MSDFNFSIDDLSSTSSIVRKATDTFYANGKTLKTSYSENGDSQRTLTQRDLQSVLGR
jgi:hypothetical protein